MSGRKPDDTNSISHELHLSRRQTLTTVGLLGAAGLSGTTVHGKKSANANPEDTGDVSVLPNPAFVTNAQGTGVPEGDELVFDTGPASIPLNRFIDADDEYDSELFESLNDSRQLVVKPPEGYDRADGYDESWPPLRWSDIADTGGSATVGRVTKPKSGDAGTEVTVEVEDAIPNGQYTIWVVKFAELRDPGEFRPSPFVSPAGNGLVGFHNLGQKFDSDGESENQFTTDSDGNGQISVVTEGGPLSGVPGFNPIEGKSIEDSPVPFVGEADDYYQSAERLNEIRKNLRAEDQISFVGAYHYDDQTWGVYPGPWHLNQFAVSFVFK